MSRAAALRLGLASACAALCLSGCLIGGAAVSVAGAGLNAHAGSAACVDYPWPREQVELALADLLREREVAELSLERAPSATRMSGLAPGGRQLVVVVEPGDEAGVRPNARAGLADWTRVAVREGLFGDERGQSELHAALRLRLEARTLGS